MNSSASRPPAGSSLVHERNVSRPRRGGAASVRLALWRTFEHSGLTQVEFAEGVLGISVDTFARWVDGRTDVRVGVLLASRCGSRFRDELIAALVSEREKEAA